MRERGSTRAMSKHRPEKVNLCGCGCGGLTAYTFVWGHHTRLFSSAEQKRRGRMNTGEALLGRGSGTYYVKRNQRHEHRTIMEKHLGRKLRSDELVHHKDRNKRNNALENLELTTRTKHISAHRDELTDGLRRWNADRCKSA